VTRAAVTEARLKEVRHACHTPLRPPFACRTLATRESRACHIVTRRWRNCDADPIRAPSLLCLLSRCARSSILRPSPIIVTVTVTRSPSPAPSPRAQVRSELLNSAALREHFANNPADLRAVQHDRCGRAHARLAVSLLPASLSRALALSLVL
jgi:hypothetical protein